MEWRPSVNRSISPVVTSRRTNWLWTPMFATAKTAAPSTDQAAALNS